MAHTPHTDAAGSAAIAHAEADPGPAPSHSVRVDPSGVAIEVGSDENLLEAATRQGFSWPSVCHGLAECGACFVAVQEGVENLSPCTADEIERLSTMPQRLQNTRRLACRVLITGDGVVVFKPGVRPKP